jgi:mono/diheme cytochrome c family protein
MTNQMPAEGSVPRGYMPYPYKPKNADDQKLAGEEMKNPVPVNEETIAHGKEQYSVYCISCHGEMGDGNGYLYTSKLFTAKPTTLIEPYVLDKKDGEIYHVITMGSLSGLMGAHGSQIKAEDRWKIINYIRTDLAK